jgi:hypothetical protein
MATFNKFNAFVEALAEKVHNLQSDQLKLALTNTAPTSAGAILTDITEITYTNLSTRNLTVGSSAQTSGTYKLTINDLVLTASGGSVGPFRYVVLYNSTPASGNLIGWYDYGSSITLADTETLTVDFDGTNGVLTIA